MKIKYKSLFGKALRILLAGFIVFMGYRIISFEFSLGKYKKAFLQVKHPENTTRIDSLDLEVNYDPATYVDDSVHFQSTFLVGEIRSYDGNWTALKTFYTNQRLDVSLSNRLPIWSLPLQTEHRDQSSRLDFPQEFSFDPFQADILQSLQEYYNSQKISQRLGESERPVYFVYVRAGP